MSSKDSPEKKGDETRQQRSETAASPSQGKSEAHDAANVQKCCHEEKKPAKWFRAPEIWTAIGTMMLGVFGIPSIIFLYWQLKESHRALIVDQRAWIHGTIDKFAPSREDGTVIVPVSLVNTGKTAARMVRADFVVAVIKNGDPLSFKYEEVAHPVTSTGILFPGDPMQFNAPLVHHATTNLRALSHSEVFDLTRGVTFIQVYGEVTYKDVFEGSVTHWLHLCRGISYGPPTVLMHEKKCTDYNDTDNN
jgi:hypothetical protein